MRNLVLPVLLGLTACSWKTFDNLKNETWAHSQKKPDGIGSSNYAIEIAAATGSGDLSGGGIAVLGADEATWSGLVLAHDGSTTPAGTATTLSVAGIAALPQQPVFVDDGQGNIALASASATGLAVVYGPAASPASIPYNPMPAASITPSAAAIVGTTIVVASGSTLYSIDTTKTPAVVTSCTALAGATMLPGISALAADDARLYAWSSDGTLYAFPLGLPTCAATAMIFTATGFSPAAPARMFITGPSTDPAQYGVLVGHVDGMTTGEVFVFDLKGTAQIGNATFTDEGIVGAALGRLGTTGDTFLALGYPDRTVNGTPTGEVDLHAFDNGVLTTAPNASLSDEQPDNGEQFGRSIAITRFNDVGIVTVAAKNEVFAYYRTLLYGETRTK